MSDSRYRHYHRLLTSPRWRAVRAAVMARTDNLCADCLAAGRSTAAVCVHHICPALAGASMADITRLTLDPLNAVALCAECHRRRHLALNAGERTRRAAELTERLGERFFGET